MQQRPYQLCPTVISSRCFWQCRHFGVPVWSVLWLHYWHLDLRTVLTLPHSAMTDCPEEWLWQGSPYEHISVDPLSGRLSGGAWLGGSVTALLNSTCVTLCLWFALILFSATSAKVKAYRNISKVTHAWRQTDARQRHMYTCDVMYSRAGDSCAEDSVIRSTVCVCVWGDTCGCVCGCAGEWVGLQTAPGPVRSSVRLCPVCLTWESLAHGGAVLSSYALVCTH